VFTVPSLCCGLLTAYQLAPSDRTSQSSSMGEVARSPGKHTVPHKNTCSTSGSEDSCFPGVSTSLSFVFTETGFHCAAQADLDLLSPSGPPTPASRVLGPQAYNTALGFPSALWSLLPWRSAWSPPDTVRLTVWSLMCEKETRSVEMSPPLHRNL
jgi:hypothetical protein